MLIIMDYYTCFLIFSAVFTFDLGRCTEFVPVFTWGTNKNGMSEHVPALHKISQDSFKDTLLEYLKKDPYIVVFAERTLSPEDFTQRDQNGESAFANIQQLKNEGNYISYRPYVQGPVEAIKSVNKPITEISIESILSSINVPKENIWIINLNDAKDGESRFHMLKRHDFDIVSIYKDILKKHDNVLVVYTANHTAWVAPEDITRGKSRNLLEGEDETPAPVPVLFNSTDTLLYLTNTGTFQDKDNNKVDIDGTANWTSSYTADATTFNAILQKDTVKIEFNFTKQITGYWSIISILAQDELLVAKDIYAPAGFSYHCSSFNVTNADKTIRLALPGFQVQAFGGGNDFGDAYDCVGFTSVAIWSGLFVTSILLLIITFGLTMMMDIRTMDRFDDPKGKTITVNVSE